MKKGEELLYILKKKKGGNLSARGRNFFTTLLPSFHESKMRYDCEVCVRRKCNVCVREHSVESCAILFSLGERSC